MSESYDQARRYGSKSSNRRQFSPAWGGLIYLRKRRNSIAHRACRYWGVRITQQSNKKVFLAPPPFEKQTHECRSRAGDIRSGNR